MDKAPFSVEDSASETDDQTSPMSFSPHGFNKAFPNEDIVSYPKYKYIKESDGFIIYLTDAPIVNKITKDDTIFYLDEDGDLAQIEVKSLSGKLGDVCMVQGFIPETPTKKSSSSANTGIDKKPRTVCFDFDGVIHLYSKGWFDGSCYDEPIWKTIGLINTLIANGWGVVILSTREPQQITDWFKEKVFPPNTESAFALKIIPDGKKFWGAEEMAVGVTNRKIPAVAYVDDRAIKFEGKMWELWQEIESFKTWQERGLEEAK